MEILSSDSLNVKIEELVFHVILKWINFNPNERKKVISWIQSQRLKIKDIFLNFPKHIIKLLKWIRTGFLSQNYFIEVIKPHPYVKESDEYKSFIIGSLKELYELDLEEDKVSKSNYLTLNTSAPNFI